MLIILHVIIAITSIGVGIYAFFRPSKKVLTGSYALIAATVASGSWLIATMHAHMLQSCMTGLGYLAVISFATVAARVKLARLAPEKIS